MGGNLARLAEYLGFDGADSGDLKQARVLETPTLQWVQLAFNQRIGLNIAFKLLLILCLESGDMMAQSTDLDRYFLRNAVSTSVGEFLWGLGLPIILESTFVPVFLSSVGASNAQIGITGTIFSFSMAFVPFSAVYFTSRMPYKKGPTVWLQVIPAISIILLGVYYVFFGTPRLAYPVFIFFYSWFAAGLAATIPVWQNFVVKIFTPRDSVRGISIMMISQNSAKLLSGVVLTFAIGAAGMSLASAGMVFLLAGAAFFIGSFSYAFARENRDKIDQTAYESPVRYFSHYFKHVLKNHSMILFLLQDIEFPAVIVSVTFYARYAIDWRSVPAPVAGGAFIIFLFIGAVSANLLLGFTRRLKIRTRYALIKTSTLLAILLLIFLKSTILFYAVSFLLGFSRSGRNQLYGPVVKGLSGLEDASPYYAISPFLMLPVSAGLPVAVGFLLDCFSAWKAVAYQAAFASLLLIVLLSLIPFLKLRFPERMG
jgi:hypothetical protein